MSMLRWLQGLDTLLPGNNARNYVLMETKLHVFTNLLGLHAQSDTPFVIFPTRVTPGFLPNCREKGGSFSLSSSNHLQPQDNSFVCPTSPMCLSGTQRHVSNRKLVVIK
jgi:hypothetical protein